MSNKRTRRPLRTRRTRGMHIRVEPDLKTKAEPILTAIGLSFSDVFNLTLNQICLKQRLPFELSSRQLTENGFTPEFEDAILADLEKCYAGVADGTLKPYESVAEMRAALDAEDDDDDA